MQPLGRLGDGGGLEHRTEGLQAFQVHRRSSITKLHVIQTFRHWTAYNILVHRAPTVSAGLTREGGPVGTVDRISGIHGKHPRRCVDLHRGHDSGGSLSAGLAVAGLSFLVSATLALLLPRKAQASASAGRDSSAASEAGGDV